MTWEGLQARTVCSSGALLALNGLLVKDCLRGPEIDGDTAVDVCRAQTMVHGIEGAGKPLLRRELAIMSGSEVGKDCLGSGEEERRTPGPMKVAGCCD